MKFKEVINTYFLGKEPIKNPTLARYQPFIIPAISLILGILILTLVTIPQLIQLTASYQTITSIETEEEELKTKISKLQQLKPDVYKADLATALIALPAEKDIPGVVDQVLIILSGSGLHLDNMTFSDGGDPNLAVKSFSIKLDVSGDISQLSEFIERIKESPRVLKINTVDLSSLVKGGSQIQSSLNVLTFYDALPSNINTEKQPVPQISEADKKILADIKRYLETVPVFQPEDQSSIPTGKSDPFQ